MPQNNFPRIVSLGVLNLDFVMELSNEMIGKKKMGRQISINAGGHGSSHRASTAALQPSSLRILRITLLLISWEPTTS